MPRSTHPRIALLAAACLALVVVAPAAAQSPSSSGASVSVPSGVFDGKRSREVLEAQVLLDRAFFSPGVIDGFGGGDTGRAIEAFQRAKGMEVTGRIDASLLERLRTEGATPLMTRYTIKPEDVSGPFVDVPDGMEGMAKLNRLAFESPAEALAERFHMGQGFLEALNPQADFGKAGTEITVVAGREGALGAKVSRIEVDGGKARVRAFASDGRLLASFPATVGSAENPSPTGKMTVNAVAPDAKYYFSPEGRDWGPDRKLTIAAGPNNPVGTTWIDLSKDGYGIHGTPDPDLIGKTASHGCVRLTNWDVEALAAAVEPGVTVEFV